MVLEKLFESGRRTLFWVSSKPNRLRVRGARIQVMAFLVTRRPEPSILLAKSVYHDIWMPPQEGVKLRENFDEALRRCLVQECGIEDTLDLHGTGGGIHLRSHRYVGLVALPADRRGERPVADDAPGTALEGITLRRKAYWMSTVILHSRDTFTGTANGTEITELRWFGWDEAQTAIATSNHPEKAALLLKALEKCYQDLAGGARPQPRLPTEIPGA